MIEAANTKEFGIKCLKCFMLVVTLKGQLILLIFIIIA
jgi:hypothetical protein